MPELPEVETTVRALQGLLTGRQVVRVDGMDWPAMFPNASSVEMKESLEGRLVTGVARRGKYTVLNFEGGETSVLIHRKMSGNLLWHPSPEGTIAHTHFLLQFLGGAELRFVDTRKFGRVHLFRSEASRQSFLASLGPEPLDLGPAHLRELLQNRRTRIKSLLLDQSFLAGIGNLYADEALWEAKIHPRRMANSLGRAEAHRLARAIHAVLMRGIENGGTTFATYLSAGGERGANQNFLHVYGRGQLPGRAAQACSRCGSAIRRDVIAQRSSHYCPKCQRPGSGVAARGIKFLPQTFG